MVELWKGPEVIAMGSQSRTPSEHRSIKGGNAVGDLFWGHERNMRNSQCYDSYEMSITCSGGYSFPVPVLERKHAR